MFAKIQIVLIITIGLGLNAKAQTADYLTKDGTWCWFSDPRAIVVDDQIITGWVKENGTIEAAKLQLNTGKVTTSELYHVLESDDHDNPAFTTTAHGDILVMYTRHSRKDLFINRQEAGNETFAGPQMIHPWSKEQLEQFPRQTMTYANLFRLEEENNRIYCFGRWTGFKPNMMWSDDDGHTWSKSKVFITNYPFDNNNRPYIKYFSDGGSRIHMVFTDGHPRVEPTNSVYYAYYENGAFYKAGGEQIATMEEIPFEPKDASVVYTSNQKEGRAWIADIGQDNEGYPVILYTRSPTETNHEYWYARYSEKGWSDHKICDSGPWFPQTPAGKREPEPHYFGGLTIHPSKPEVVYLSREINGVFEIERWETRNDGKSWKSEPVTQNSSLDQVRPYVPRGLESADPEIVLWMENQKYIHYTDFRTSIKYNIRKD